MNCTFWSVKLNFIKMFKKLFIQQYTTFIFAINKLLHVMVRKNYVKTKTSLRILVINPHFYIQNVHWLSHISANENDFNQFDNCMHFLFYNQFSSVMSLYFRAPLFTLPPWSVFFPVVSVLRETTYLLSTDPSLWDCCEPFL